MSLVAKTRVSIFKNFFVFVLMAVLLNSFFISVVIAENTETYYVISGVDQSSGIPEIFTEDDIEKLSFSDSEPGNGVDRMRSDKWPDENTYVADRYIEFIFSPNVPINAVINEVKINHEFQRSSALALVKIEVWDGVSFVEIPGSTVGTSGVDHVDVLDASNVLDTAGKINNTKVRFSAYRATPTASGTTTGHDFISLSVNYILPDSEDDSPDSGAGTVILDDIITDTTWTKEGSPYVVNEDITLASGATLIIEPGVVVEFNSSIFFVEGVLKVLGTEEDPVYFDGYMDLVISNDSGNSVLNHIINRSNLFVFYEGGRAQSTGLDTNNDILFFETNSEFLDLKATSLYLYDSSMVEINDSLFSGEAKIEVQDYSNLILKNSKVESLNQDTIVNIYNNASASFTNVDILSLDQSNSGISVFGNSNLNFKDGSLSGSRDGFLVYNDSHLNILNTGISCDNTGISVYNNSAVDFDTGSVNCGVYGVSLFNNVQANFKKVKVFGAMDSGFIVFNNFGDSFVKITDSEITDNLYGFVVYDSVFSANKSNIHNNILSGAFTFRDVDLDFNNNYWGDATGPYNVDLNPGAKGDSVSEHILFEPWLPSWPPVEECVKNCNSNVMFFPGVQGSRMYGEVFDCSSVTPRDPMFCGDQQLWVSPHKVLQEFMFLDEFGKSKNNVYTKNDTESVEGDGGELGVIDEALTVNIYKSFIGDLRNWKNPKVSLIEDYALIPYDWRLSLEDIITNGKVLGENLSYLNRGDFSESFIVSELRELQRTSRTGKVTLIAHSTGGLVIKALVQKLKDTNDPLYNQIEKIIFVAVPQVGTPEATIAMLHGVPLGPFGILMPSERSREFGENMPTIYNLAPSSGYFNTVDTDQNPILAFQDHPLLEDLISKYGNFINTKEELKDFVLGGDERNKPSVSDTDKPNIVNEYLYSQAELTHEIIDNWQPSPNTKIIEVAGWGEETKVGLKYVIKRKLLGLGREYVSHKPIVSVDGDSTVAFPSALWMENRENVEEWVINLPLFNSLPGPRRDHKNILEIQNLINFIQAQITDKVFTDNEGIVLKNDNLNFVANNDRLHFTLHSPLTLGIFDKEGRYTGLDPVTKEIKQEIPNVNYDMIGTVQFISAPAGIPYTLQLDGYEEGSFTLDVERQEGNSIIQENYFEMIPTSDKTLAYLDIGEDFEVGKAELQVDSDGDGTIDTIYPKVATSDPVMPPSSHGAVILINKDNEVKKELVLKTANITPSIGMVLGVESEIPSQSEDIKIQKEEKVLIENKSEGDISVEVQEVAGEGQKESVDVKKEKNSNKNTSFYVTIFIVLLSSFLIKRLIKI